MIDEDPFPPMASVNLVVTDLRVVLNEKKDERFSPNGKKRKVCILKQNLVHKDDMTLKGKVSTTIKRKIMKGIHTIQNRK